MTQNPIMAVLHLLSLILCCVKISREYCPYFYPDFFFFLQHDAVQILSGGNAPIPCRTDGAVALYCSPPSPPACKAGLQWHSQVFCLECGDSGSGWAALKRKMSPLHGEGVF